MDALLPLGIVLWLGLQFRPSRRQWWLARLDFWMPLLQKMRRDAVATAVTVRQFFHGLRPHLSDEDISRLLEG